MDLSHVGSAITVTLALLACLWRFATLTAELKASMTALGKDIEDLKKLGVSRETIPSMERRIARLEDFAQDAATRLVRMEAKGA